MALDFQQLVLDVAKMPTVQAGIILALGRIRNEMEAFVAAENLEGMAELLRDLDAHSPELADAIVERTPAQAAHEQRAAAIQEQDES